MNSQKIVLLSNGVGCRHLLRRKIQTNTIINSEFLEISDEIKQSNKPMVALESTIITHGLPFPNNMETALQVEEEIRKVGALPATIAFINGKLRVGLKRDEIEMIAKRQTEAIKISRRDLPYVFSREECKIGGQRLAYFEFHVCI
jgi:pseudouridine-5'-phosphate glycosidase